MPDISNDILKEFKDSMKISHGGEDDNLKRLLSSSLVALNESCGAFGFDDEMGKELVFNRARYAYNDSLEFFDQNFLTAINNLAISLMSSESTEDTEDGGDDGG